MKITGSDWSRGPNVVGGAPRKKKIISSKIEKIRYENELERNITIKLGYSNAKIYRCDDIPRNL